MTSGNRSGTEGRGRWADLGVRVTSAAVLIVIAVILAWSSGIWLRLGVSVLTGTMIWELARMTAWSHPEFHTVLSGEWRPLITGILAALMTFLALTIDSNWAVLLLGIPAFAGMLGARNDLKPAFVLFAVAMGLGGYGLVLLLEAKGFAVVGWIVGCVILSDVAGYFAGKQFGGPKFWPAISPKKTWSGTVAGWLAAALYGLVLVVAGHAGPLLILLSPLVAFAGQMGDIAESWLKRRTGVKDSSNLIPGHGGVMDRFDAMTGAILAALLIWLLSGLPQIGTGG
ncbi:phosphatidate cytidylyltransferase [Paracoccus pacificus]|uniref:Phosphatidate cytidylyltransferase n=1 Tax=Paracoccus pacificus TaxID=1463598 RepID=A0ABW4R516_9RHOB